MTGPCLCGATDCTRCRPGCGCSACECECPPCAGCGDATIDPCESEHRCPTCCTCDEVDDG